MHVAKPRYPQIYPDRIAASTREIKGIELGQASIELCKETAEETQEILRALQADAVGRRKKGASSGRSFSILYFGLLGI